MALNRSQYVLTQASIFASIAAKDITIEDLERFANGAEEVAHERSREVAGHFKDDEMALTSHAAHMRTIAAKIVLLRDGYVPALKIDKESPTMHAEAVRQMGFLRAEFEAMTMMLTD